MNTRSFTFRVTAWYGGLLAVSFLVSGFAVHFALKTYLHWQLRSKLNADATTIAETVLERYAAPEAMAQKINEEFAPEVNALFVRITDESGKVVYLSAKPLDGSFDSHTVAPLTAEKLPPGLFHWTRYSGRAALYIDVLPYTTHAEKKFLVEVGQDHQKIHDTLRALDVIFAIGMPLMIVLAAIGGRYVLASALRPVREITHQAEKISRQSPDVRLPVVHTGDELEQLSKALNHMLHRLDAAFSEIERFSGDVSHELRTPLTVMRGELESLLTSQGRDDARGEQIGSCLEEVERMSRIVDRLLSLARLDAGKDDPQQTLDFSALTVATMQELQLLLDDKSLRSRLDIQPHLFVCGSELRLKQVTVNLLDNAIKYSRSQGTINVSLKENEGQVVLEVADDGEGIPSEALPHVFERFYRADKARSRETGGSGLGLSIVKAIATSYGGSVSIRSVEGRGTAVTFSLPSAADVADEKQLAGSAG